MAITPDTTTLEYYQSIYTHCKQRFNIPDGIEIVERTLYQYIENLKHLPPTFKNLITTLSSIAKKNTQQQRQKKVKQHSKTASNTPILPKTTVTHLQTPEQGTSVKLPLSITSFPISLSSKNSTQQQKPILTSTNIIEYLQENKSDHSENLESKKTESKQGEVTENEEEMATAYIAKIPEFTGEDNDTSPQEWLDKIQKAEDANGWITARMLKAILYFLQRTAGEWFENLEELFENWQTFKDVFLQQFTNNNTSITLRNRFCNIKQKTSKTFIAGLKDKLIKKVCLHAPADLATVIKHAKNYEIAIKEANHTKLVNLAIGETTILQTNNNSSNNPKNINHYSDTIKTTLDHYPTTNLKIVTIVEFQDTGNKIAGNYKETNKTGTPLTQQYQILARRLVQHNQFTFQNQLQSNNNRINPNNQLVPRNSGQQRPNYYHTQPSYLTIPEESDFQQTAFSEGEVAVPRSNPFNHTIPPAQIAQNANLSDIFPFEFEANELPFLLSNAAVNEQKTITAMYTEATVKEKPICLILDSGLAENRPAQTVIVTVNDMKKTPVGEINDFPFTIDGITILVKVLVMNAPQYQALVGNDWLFKANANLNWKTQELKISYQGQYTIVSATCSIFNKQSEKAPVFEFEEEKKMPLTETYMALGSPSNWAEETEQEIFEESRR
ncbi:hypothetical protein G9A89_017344 [Geosiphon pyriformis]|nr:hypothetical protein G9A89_017344 [Geosiphon pyriformis]